MTNNKNIVQEVGIKCCVCSILARKMYSIRILLNFSVGLCTRLHKNVLAIIIGIYIHIIQHYIICKYYIMYRNLYNSKFCQTLHNLVPHIYEKNA
jgi:hypothetical protein